MPSFLVEADETPAEEAHAQLLVSVYVLLDLLDEGLVLRTADADDVEEFIASLISDQLVRLLLVILQFLHAHVHVFEGRTSWRPLIQTILRIEN